MGRLYWRRIASARKSFGHHGQESDVHSIVFRQLLHVLQIKPRTGAVRIEKVQQQLFAVRTGGEGYHHPLPRQYGLVVRRHRGGPGVLQLLLPEEGGNARQDQEQGSDGCPKIGFHGGR
jgi:hypothetical protein